MKNYKKMLALLLTAGMVFSCVPASVYAAQSDETFIQLAEDDEEDLESQNAGENEETDQNEAEAIAGDSGLEYLYVGEKIINTEDTQEVIAAIDASRIPEDGTLWYTVNDEEEEKSAEAAAISDNGMLFNLGDFAAYEEGSTVVLTRITYTYRAADSEDLFEQEIILEDEEIRAEFTLTCEAVNEATVTLDTPDLSEDLVIEAENIAEMEEADAAAAHDEVETTYYIMNPDAEEIEKADSLEEALEAALGAEDLQENIPEIASEQTDPEKDDLELAEGEQSDAGAGDIVIALDPGHDSKHSGANYGGYREEDINLPVALACKAELEKYAGVKIHMTRTESGCPNPDAASAGGDNIARINKAVKAGAKVYIAFHMNAAGSELSTANGALVFIPNRNYKPELFQEGTALGLKILKQLEGLGLKNRGTVVTNSTDNTLYPDGSLADYYTVNEECKRLGITGIIIEHGFMSNPDDLAFIADPENQVKMGTADATAIAQQYGLVKSGATVTPSTDYHVEYQSHVQSIGWKDYVRDGASAGTSGQSLRMEALRIRIVKTDTDKYGKTTTSTVKGAVTYQAHVQRYGWMDWVKDDAMAGTEGESKRVEAFAIQLTGDLANEYDIWYRVHSQRVGWLGWTKNGALAGTAEMAYRMEDMQIKLVKKGGPAPGDTKMPFYSSTIRGDVTYQGHVQTYGWMDSVADGEICGTEGESKRVEDIKIWLNNPIDETTGKPITGDIVYRAHVQTYGWLDWVKNGDDAGTEGEGKRIESVQIKLTGKMAEKYDIYYRVHCQTYGTLGWAKNGVTAGTAGYSKRVESLQIRLVDKKDTATIKALEAQGTDSYKIASDSMYFRAVDTNGKGQVIQLTAYNTHSVESFTSVEFAVWSNENGAGDIAYYKGLQTSEGIWTTNVDTAKHSGLGDYSCKVYGVRANGDRVYLGDDNFTAKERQVVNITVTTGSEMSAQQIFDYLVKSGLTKEGAAGLMGNLYCESALRSKNLQNSYEKSLGMTDDEYTTAVDNGSYENFVNDKAGYGLAQWTYWSRKEALLDFRNSAGTSIGNCRMQLDFLMKELRGYPTLYKTLTTTDSVATASKDVLQIYERPATYQELSTIAYRESISYTMYDNYAR